MMNAKTAEKVKLTGAALALAIAAVGFVRFYKSSNPAEGKAYFYDLSGKKLFTAPHSSVPPIKGVVGEEEDGVRAVVISTTGNCEDASSRKIAYLEKYTAELKRQVELQTSDAPPAADQEAPRIRRGEAHGLILIKLPEEEEWHPMTSKEGEAILKSINTPGPDGRTPVVCVP